MKYAREWFLRGLALILVTYHAFAGLSSVEMHIDEHEWLRRSALLYDAAFVRKDPHDPIWNDFLSLDQTNGTEFLYGIWSAAYYRQNPLAVMDQIRFNEPYKGTLSEDYGTLWSKDNWWIKYAFISPAESAIPQEYVEAFRFITVNRIFGTLCYVATMALVYLIVKSLFGESLAVTAALLYAFMPIHTPHSRQAMLGSVVTLFFTWSLLSFITLDPTRLRPVIRIGIILGLTSIMRLDGWIALLLVVGGLLTEYLILPHASKRILITIVLVTGICAGIFYGFTPYVWSAPISKLNAMVKAREAYTAHTLAEQLTPELALPTYPRRFMKVAEHLFIPYPSRITLVPILEIANAVAGIWILIRISFVGANRRRGIRTLWFITGMYGAVSLYLGVDYPRYYLPILPLAAIIQAAGLSLWTSRITDFRKKHARL